MKAVHLVAAVAAAIIVAGGGYWLGARNAAERPAPAVATPTEDPAVTSARAKVLRLLNDPDSAQFRDVRRADETTVCGEVNAKNGFGGYVGFTPFIGNVAGDGEVTVHLLVDPPTVGLDEDERYRREHELRMLIGQFVRACGVPEGARR